MKFDLQKAIEILSRTPKALQVQLTGLSDEWIYNNEGPGTWSPFEVVGHLIVNEETNFLPRTLLILSNEEHKILSPVNMTAHLEQNSGKKMTQLLSEFSGLRLRNMETLKALNISDDDFRKTAIHPKVGRVCLSNILSIWVAHDLTHIGQIARVMAKQYKQEIGPFIEFLPRLQ